MFTSLHVLHVGSSRRHYMVTGSKKNRKKTDKAEESKTQRHSKLANMVKRN